MKLIKTFLYTLVALLFISCGDNTETPLTDVLKIEINELNTTIYSTDDSTDLTAFTATVYYEDGTSADATNYVTWNSSDTGIATVSNGAVIGGNSNGGDTNITITYDHFTSPASLVSVIALTDYNISILNADANATGTYDLLATGKFEDNTTRTIVRNITWDTNNSALLTVEDDIVQIEITTTGDTNITATLFDDINTSQTIIYTVDP